MELKDKVAIVTGSTSGMGKAIATLLAKSGAKLIIHGRDVQKGEAFNDQLKSEGHSCFFVAGDIGRPDTNRELVQKALEHYGRLDIVVANAGMLGLGNIVEVDEETWHNTMDVNLNAVFYLMRFAIPVMNQAGSGCILVNSSIAAFKSFPNHPAYCASKAGVVALTRQIALDYGPAIRANAICPGPVDTPFLWDSAIAFPDPATAVQEAGLKTALKRLGTAEDIASVVLFLVSDRSSWMTGAVITIDGGVTIT
jgi:NAD(P)-dependent dehydrogenase (short-subunit alcohol dehydrogenase family)